MTINRLRRKNYLYVSLNSSDIKNNLVYNINIVMGGFNDENYISE